MGRKTGAIKTAAKKIGISFEEYVSKAESGLKWCHKCASWKRRFEFNKDSTRSDGLNATCRGCQSSKTLPGPTLHERRHQREKGFAWCSGCKEWLPSAEVRSGKCKKHHAEYARQRYADDKRYRQERKQHSKSRRRDIRPLPPEAQDVLMEEFDGECAYCGEPAASWDHIFPVSKGGDTTPGNIVPACISCNSSKRTKDVITWLDETGKEPSQQLYERMCLALCGLYG